MTDSRRILLAIWLVVLALVVTVSLWLAGKAAAQHHSPWYTEAQAGQAIVHC